MKEKIALGSDKSGFALKEAVKAYLVERGVGLAEVGTLDAENGVPFFETAPQAAALLQRGECSRAILICGTGMGMSQVANKYKGIRAACVESVYAARMCRAVNDSNILCMGGWIIAPEMGVEMVKAFLDTAHTEGLEPWRRDFLLNAKAEFKRLEAEIYSAAR